MSFDCIQLPVEVKTFEYHRFAAEIQTKNKQIKQQKSIEKCINMMFYPMFMFQVVEDGYEFFAKRQLVTLFSAPNYCGEFDNAGGMMSVDDTLMCSFQVDYTLQDITYKNNYNNYTIY